MEYCVKCGVFIQEGSNFCTGCGDKVTMKDKALKQNFQEPVSRTHITEPSENVLLVRSRVGRENRLLENAKIVKYFIGLLGVSIFAFCLVILIPGANIEIFSIVFVLSGLFITFALSRDSSMDSGYFIGSAITIITIGTLPLVGVHSFLTVLVIGFVLSGLILIFTFSRNSTKNGSFFVVVALIILTFGITILSPESMFEIVPIGCILISFVLIFWVITSQNRQNSSWT